tara:strand:+ start:1096 stop:1404 length:309 start_codon:yes stop_codon:yes gene_type:complete
MLHIAKYEMRSDADRNAFGMAALGVCNAAKVNDGVNDAKFFWVNPNLIGIIVDAEKGAWGSDADPSADVMKAFFVLADLSNQVSNEIWMSASIGEERFKMTK